MNPIVYALNHVRHTIPQQILQMAFSPQAITNFGARWGRSNETFSIDSKIRSDVIDGRVNIDCNLYGSMQIAVDLSRVPFEQFDQATRVFQIPYDMTGGRRIVSAQSVTYMNYHGMAGVGHGNTNQLMSAAKDLYKAIAQMPIVATAEIQIVGDNVIMVRDNVSILTDHMALTCTVENDAEMNNLNPGIFPLYAQMVEQATKAYVYNSTAVSMDQGALHGGMQLGRIREIIDEYRDANELYQQLLVERWQKGVFTNDRPRMDRFIGSMFGRGR